MDRQRDVERQPEEARPAHAQRQGPFVGAGNKVLRQIDVHPLRRIGRRHFHHREGEEVLRLLNGIHGSRLRHCLIGLGQHLGRLRDALFQLLQRQLLRRPRRHAVGKIRHPGREGLLRCLFENGGIKPGGHLVLLSGV